MIDYLHGLMDS